MTKAEAQGFGWLLLIGVPLAGIYLFIDAIGWIWMAIGVASVVGIYIWHKVQQEKEHARQQAQRRAELLHKYGDERIVEAIMQRKYWRGQTAEQLRDSLGSPDDIDEKVLKTKKKAIWKYHHMGGNRFGLRITLEQEQVVGWDEKM